MRFNESRHVGALVVVLCAVLVSGCNVTLTNQSPYYFRADAGNGVYPLTLKVEEGSNANVTAVETRVNGQWYPMTGSGETWTYSHPQALPIGLKVAHRVTYTHPSWLLVPTQSVNWLPDGGDWQVPILHEDADSDADGRLDRYDNCVFHPNPDQAMGPTYANTNGSYNIGAVCDAESADLGHIGITQPGDPNVVKMRDNRGNRMIDENGHSYYAFQTLVSSIGRIRDFEGVSSALDAGPVAIMTVEIMDCQLQYQDPDRGRFGWFIEVYAADQTHPCTFAIKKGSVVLLTGSDVLITVQTRVDTSIDPVLRLARMAGRVTLHTPPPGSTQDALDISEALTRNSPLNYVYFSNPDLTSIVDTMGATGAQVEGAFTGETNIVFRP